MTGLLRGAHGFEGLGMVEVVLLVDDPASIDRVDARRVESHVDAGRPPANLPDEASDHLVRSLKQLVEDKRVSLFPRLLEPLEPGPNGGASIEGSGLDPRRVVMSSASTSYRSKNASYSAMFQASNHWRITSRRSPDAGSTFSRDIARRVSGGTGEGRNPDTRSAAGAAGLLPAGQDVGRGEEVRS